MVAYNLSVIRDSGNKNTKRRWHGPKEDWGMGGRGGGWMGDVVAGRRLNKDIGRTPWGRQDAQWVGGHIMR